MEFIQNPKLPKPLSLTVPFSVGCLEKRPVFLKSIVNAMLFVCKSCWCRLAGYTLLHLRPLLAAGVAMGLRPPPGRHPHGPAEAGNERRRRDDCDSRRIPAGATHRSDHLLWRYPVTL